MHYLFCIVRDNTATIKQYNGAMRRWVGFGRNSW
jgi:hypothetical protein